MLDPPTLSDFPGLGLLVKLPEILPHPFYIKNQEGQFVFANVAFTQLYQTTPAALINQGLYFDFSFDRDQEVLASKQTSTFSEGFKLPGGAKIWFSTFKKVFQAENDQLYLLSLSTEIGPYKPLPEGPDITPTSPFEFSGAARINIKETVRALNQVTQELADVCTAEAGQNKIEAILKLVGEMLPLVNGPASPPGSFNSAAAIAPAQSSVPASKTSHPIQILLADDNLTIRELAAAQLRAWGLAVDATTNGAEALVKAREKSYDLILMDIQMPEMDGMATTRIIRQEKPNRHTPIIAFTANIYNLVADEYKNSGFTDLLAKPYTEPELYRVIQRYFPELKPQEVASDSLYDFSGLGDLGRDALFIRKMQKLFIQTVPPQLVQLGAALARQDYDEVAAIAHKLKATYGNIKITEPAAAMKQMEILAQKKTDLTALPALLYQAEIITARVIESFSQQLQSAE